MFGAHAYREEDLLAQVFARVLVEDDEIVVVVNLEYLGGISHAQGIAFAFI